PGAFWPRRSSRGGCGKFLRGCCSFLACGRRSRRGGDREWFIRMVDLHCHILPGLDDGPATMEESMAMAQSAIADGITHVVATPHSSNEYLFEFSHVRQLRDELQGKVGDRLKIATGCDFHLNPENLGSLRMDARQF